MSGLLLMRLIDVVAIYLIPNPLRLLKSETYVLSRVHVSMFVSMFT